MVEAIYKLIIGFLLVAFSVSCNQSRMDENVLAEINGLEVTDDHFVSAFKKYYYRSGESLVPSFQNKSSVLENEFNVYVLVNYARDKGLANDQQSSQIKGLIERKVSVEEYIEREVLSNVDVAENDLRELFYRFNTELEAAHLYAKDEESAWELYNRLQAGEKFELLARETFQNKYLAENGGNIGRFTVDEMDIAFENAAFGLKVGETSEPVKTNLGYSIIKLINKNTMPIITETEYASAKNRLHPFALQRNEELAKRAHIEETIASLNIDDELIAKIWEAVDLNHGGNLGLDHEAGILQINAGIFQNELLASNSNFTFTFGDLKQEGYYSPDENLYRINEYHRFENYVKGIIYRTWLIREFRKKYSIKEPPIKGSIDQTFYIYLNQRAEEHIKESIEITEQELRTEFNTNRHMYDFPLRLNLSRIVVESKEKGEEVLSALNTGMSWEDALTTFTIKSEDLMVNGELGLMPVQEFGTHAFFIKDMEVGEIVGPLEYQTGQLMIYKALEVLEPRPANFSEVRELVKKVLTEQKFNEKKKEAIEQTKKNHQAVLNLDHLQSLKIKL